MEVFLNAENYQTPPTEGAPYRNRFSGHTGNNAAEELLATGGVYADIYNRQFA